MVQQDYEPVQTPSEDEKPLPIPQPTPYTDILANIQAKPFRALAIFLGAVTLSTLSLTLLGSIVNLHTHLTSITGQRSFGALSLTSSCTSSSDVIPAWTCQDDDICRKYGYDAIMRSQSYVGTGRNFQHFLNKLVRGENVTIAVLGGSVSSCIGFEAEDCYSVVLERLLNQRLEPYRGNIKVINAAIPAIGSELFVYCWPMVTNYAPIDLFILEHSINDPEHNLVDKSAYHLMQNLLNSERKPSVMILDVYSPTMNWFSAAVSVNALGQYFDLPVISHRNVLYLHRHTLTTPEEVHKWWLSEAGSVYGHHANPQGHQLIAELVVFYLEKQLRDFALYEDNVEIKGTMDIHYEYQSDWPPWRKFTDDYTPEDFGQQGCHTADAGPNQIVVVPPTIGFEFDHWKTKNYLVGKNVGDRVTISVKLTTKVFIKLFYWKSATLGFGRASCGFDQDVKNEGRLVLDGYWNQPTNVPVTATIDAVNGFTGPGEYTITCEIVAETSDPNGGHEFRISALGV